MSALALALLVAAAPAQAAPGDAPVRRVVEVSSALLMTTGGLEEQVLGGAWLSDPTLIDVAKELVGLRAEVVALRAAPAASAGPPLAIVVVASLSVMAGFGLGLLAARAVP